MLRALAEPLLLVKVSKSALWIQSDTSSVGEAELLRYR